MKTSNWLSRSVAILKREYEPKEASPPAAIAVGAAKKDAINDASVRPERRSIRDRLAAQLKQPDEALSPRMLRRTLAELKAVIDPQVSEVEGGRRALALAGWYAKASPQQRYDAWLLMSEQFMSDPEVVKRAQAEYAAAVGTADEPAAEVLFRRATVSPRRRLLQRFSAFPQGIPFLVALRAEMLTHLKSDKRLRALDVEMEYMFSTWFDVGFLDLRPINWDSPASLLEKLIRYEAVHDIRSWADLKNRLDSDRRCYAFFHPRLPDEPLIFVEVALMDHMADSITPLLDESADASDLNRATTAIFYSISNTQTGLRGVSFGDSLIKRVVESLKAEFPRLKTFATLSPIPGLRSWLSREAPAELLASAEGWTNQPAHEAEVLKSQLMALAARYLARDTHQGDPLDPVARFHLGNGARVERINWAADPSARGMRQSLGLMVNYLYDLDRLDDNRAQLAKGRIPASRAVKSLMT